MPKSFSMFPAPFPTPPHTHTRQNTHTDTNGWFLPGPRLPGFTLQGSEEQYTLGHVS